jgi:hypothetical protein
MKRVAVLSPLRSGFFASPGLAGMHRTQLQNEALAKVLMREVLDQGHAPFLPHLLYPLVLDDRVKEQRDAGINAGLAWLAVAEEARVFTGLGITGGMRREISQCLSVGVSVVYPEGWDVLGRRP